MSAKKSFVALFVLSLLFVGLAQARAGADAVSVQGDHVTLGMLLPALEGSELGALEVAKAPLPGETHVIRAGDIRARLRESGRDARGLAIPKSVRVVRRARELSESDLEERIATAVAPEIAPCTLEQVSSLPKLKLGEGEFAVTAEPLARKSSGRTNVSVTVAQGERVQRISVQAVLTCPEPVIMPGARITIVVQSGAVRVSAPGVANQPGRVGDEIRVTNQLTKKALQGRVLDAQSVEVIP